MWDVFGEKEFLGGAPLNFSAAVQRLGHTAALLTAVGADRRGSLATAAMKDLGLTTDLVQTVTGHCTGAAIVTTDSTGSATFVIERPTAFDFVELNDSIDSNIRRLRPEWIYFGTLAQTMENGEKRLRRLLEANPGARCFYDVNLRRGHWNLALVQRLSRFASIIKLNETEAEHLFSLTFGSEEFSLEKFCRHWASAYGITVVCVTSGSRGCAVFTADVLHPFAGYSIRVSDTVGAGDAFAAAFLHGLNIGWPMRQIAHFANALGALVASRAGAIPNWTIDECMQMISTSTCARI